MTDPTENEEINEEMKLRTFELSLHVVSHYTVTVQAYDEQEARATAEEDLGYFEPDDRSISVTRMVEVVS